MSTGDRLRTLNDQLRRDEVTGAANGSTSAAADDESPCWLPLESNPVVFTSFARRVASLPEPWEFRDVLGLDRDLLALTPRPVAAVILLFPCTEAMYKARVDEERERLRGGGSGGGAVGTEAKAAVEAAYHVEQVASFGNACGTIAAIHALTNADLGDGDGGSGSGKGGRGSISPLAAFRAETLAKTATERGRALLTSRRLRNASDGAAEHESAQTACPARDGPDLDHHYCAFVPVSVPSSGAGPPQMRVVELDGTKAAPVDRGAVPEGKDFMEAAADVVRRRFVAAVEPGCVEFSLMALCRPAPGTCKDD